MSKQSSQTNQLDSWSDTTLTEWLSAYKYYIIYGLIGLLALILLANRLMTTRNLHAEADFLQAQFEFSLFQDRSLAADRAESQQSLDKLKSFLQSYPDLHAKYDGLIAQSLLIDQDPTQARSFAEKAWSRTSKDGIDLYHDYSQTSVLISEGQYEQALSQAQQLKQRMSQEGAKEFNDLLYSFNLVRLGILYQQLNDPLRERETWEELQTHQIDPEAFTALNQVFKEGGVSLNHYVKERYTTLAP